jgi:hypothetical protein
MSHGEKQATQSEKFRDVAWTVYIKNLVKEQCPNRIIKKASRAAKTLFKPF